MRIETVITEYKIYKYNELSDEVKENVKEWYLESIFKCLENHNGKVSDEEVAEMCEANEYEFLEDGSLY